MKLTILGAGCWGLTLAWLLTDNFDEITVWGRAQDLSDDLINNKHTSKPLEVQLKNKVQITSELDKAIENSDIILSVVALSQILLGAVQGVMVAMGMPDEISTSYRVYMSAATIILSIPILVKRNFVLVAITYLTAIIIYLFHTADSLQRRATTSVYSGAKIRTDESPVSERILCRVSKRSLRNSK